MTQFDYILEHLKRYGSIEPLTALREYGCYRLGAVIYNIRKCGYNVTTERMEGFSRITGRRIMFAKYRLTK